MAVELLYPAAAGDETAITSQYPASSSHYDKVDEANPDDNATYVYCTGNAYLRDLYRFQPHAIGSGTIASVTVYFRIKINYDLAQGAAKPSQKTGTVVTDGMEVYTGNSPNVWTTHSQSYTTNPATGNAYTWAEIDALQVGVALWPKAGGSYYEYCTQVYIAVTYYVNIVTTALTRVTSLTHYYNRASNIYRLSINMGGLAPLMMPYMESKAPPSPIAPPPPPPPPPMPIITATPTTNTSPSPIPTPPIPTPATPTTPNTSYPDYPDFIQPPLPPVLPVGAPPYAPMLPDYYGAGYDPHVPYYGGQVSPGNGMHLPSGYTTPIPPPYLPPASPAYAPMMKDYYFKGYDPSKPYYGGGKQ